MMNAKKTPTQDMGKSKREKQEKKSRSWIRMGLLIALLLTAALLLWRSNAGPTELVPRQGATASAPPSASTPTPTTRRSGREAAYDKDIATLTALIKNELTDADTRTQAAELVERMVADHQTELGIQEALLQAGFRPCVVLLQNGALTVMVGAEELSGSESVTILSICVAHTDIGVENIRIMTGEEG